MTVLALLSLSPSPSLSRCAWRDVDERDDAASARLTQQMQCVNNETSTQSSERVRVRERQTERESARARQREREKDDCEHKK